MVFANIEYLFLLLLLIPYIVWYIMKRKNSEATLQISDARVYAHTPKSYKNYLLHVPFVLRIIALILLFLFWHVRKPPIAGRTVRLRVLISCLLWTFLPVCWPKT